MKFVGGVLHGQDVKAVSLGNDFVIGKDFIEVVGTLNGFPFRCTYMLSEWFVAPDVPMIDYYSLVGIDCERLIALGREVFS